MNLRWLLISTIATGCTLLHAKHKSDEQQHIDPGPWEGPLAQKYAGKVVFSSAPIKYDATDDSGKYDSYTLGDPLFIRMWAADSPHNLQFCNAVSMTGNQAMRTIHVYADVNGVAGTPVDKMAFIGSYDVDEEHVNKRIVMSLTNDAELAFTTPTSVAGGAPIAGEETVRRFNTNIVPKLKDGDNTLRIVVALRCANRNDLAPMADGTLAVHVPDGAKATYLAKYGAKVAPSPNPENDMLSREIVLAMKKMPDWDNEIFVGASVTSQTWQPVRNEDTGVLVAMQIEAMLFVRQKKEKDPDACRVFQMSYRRDPAGGVLYHAGTGSSKPFPCSAAPH